MTVWPDLHRAVRLVVLLGTLLACVPAPAFAWWSQGHMMISAVAWPLLDPPIRLKVEALLQKNPDYPLWISGVAPDRRGLIAFERASMWADAIKDGRTHPEYISDGEVPNGPEAAQNIGYADRLQHRYWHFIDTPFSTDGTTTHAPPVPNAAERIALFRRTLAAGSGASDALRSYDLVWLIHIVGDVHQPLHAADRYAHSTRHGDAGGNLVKLGAPMTVNLHGFWDSLAGDSDDPEVAWRAVHATHFPQADRGPAAIADENVWIEESVQIARTYVYRSPIGPGKGPYALTTAYIETARTVAAERIALAGVRLANLLNEALK